MFEDLSNRQGERLDATYHAPDSDPRELVVIGHGVTGNKDRAWAVTLAETLAASGYGALRLSFSGNGESEGRFEDSCPTKEAEDLSAALDAAESAGFVRTIYVGHSMGGAVGVLAASRDRRIAALVSLAGMVGTADFAQRKFGEQSAGDFMWDKPDCPLSEAFLADMRTIDSVAPLAKQVHVPWLLVHGRADTVVPLTDSIAVAERTEAPVELALLPGVDHVFDGCEGMMATRVVRWLESLELG